jgi:hypothetical protein
VTGRADGWIFSVVNSCRESLAWLPLDCADQFLFTRASQGARVFVFNTQAPENTFRISVSPCPPLAELIGVGVEKSGHGRRQQPRSLVGVEVTRLILKRKLETPHVVSCHFPFAMANVDQKAHVAEGLKLLADSCPVLPARDLSEFAGLSLMWRTCPDAVYQGCQDGVFPVRG